MKKYVFLVHCIALGLMIGFPLTESAAQPIQTTPEYQAASQFLAQNSFETALDEIKKLIGHPKHHGAAMVEIGKIRSRQGETEMSLAMAHFSEAAESLRAGIEAGAITGPELPKTLYDLGRIYEERLRNYVSAAETYEKIVEEHPEFLSIDKVYFHLASCYELTGRREEAVAHYKKLVTDYSFSSHFKAAQEKMKELAIGTSTESGAIEAQARLVDDAEEGSGEARAGIDLGDMQAEAGNFSKAVDAYKKAALAAGDPEVSLNAYKKMVDILDNKQKDYEGAAKALEEMLQKFPDAEGSDEAMYRLGRIYEEDLDSMKTQVIDGRVRYRKSSENVEKAINHYNSVTEKFPDADISAEAFLRKGELYEKELKDYDQARNAYENFLRKFPNHDEAGAIREKLEEIRDY
ncbi:MAG: tetratricopeptide repeat protein [Candidatus Rifleibacteriota bacterium]